jgi:cyclopropane fatty-acyl-phospholipid synthase-like methyltransferase
MHEVIWTPQKISEFWSYFSSKANGDRIYFSGLFGDQIIDVVEKYVPLSGSRILDFGCGQGFMIERLITRALPAEGLEFSAVSAETTRARLQQNPCFMGVTVAEKLPSLITDGTIDVVFLVEVLEHLLPEQVTATFNDIRRILKAGGYLVLTTPNNEDLERVKTMCPECRCIFHPWQHLNSYNPSLLNDLVQKYGFDTVFCEAMNLGKSKFRRLVSQIAKRATGHGSRMDEPHLVYIGRALA